MAGALALVMAFFGPTGQGADAQQSGATPAPPTAQQTAVPPPAYPVQTTDKPLKTSPGAAQLPNISKRPLTITDAVAVALSMNRSLATALENLLEAHGVTVSKRAGQGLTGSLSYSLTRYNEEQATNLGGQSLVIQPQYSNQVAAILSLPLDVNGSLRAATSQAQFQELAARLDVSRVRNEVVLGVKSAFYTVLRDQALVVVAETSLKNAETQLRDAQLRLQAGTVARYDVLSAQTLVSNARQTLRARRNALSLALDDLKSRMGIDLNTPIQITTEGAVEVPKDLPAALPPVAAADAGARADLDENRDLKPGQLLGDLGAEKAANVRDFVVKDPQALGPEFESLLAEALKNRPEVQREQANVAAAQRGVAIARSGLLPSLSVSYEHTYTPNASGLSSQKQAGYVMLNLSVPLFDSGATRGRVTQARALVSSAETARRTQIDTVTSDVRQALLNLSQYRDELSTARQELAQADEAYRIARLRYSAGVTSQSGVSPLIELSNAEQNLTQAQSDYVNALYDFNNGRSALDKAVGRYAGAADRRDAANKK